MASIGFLSILNGMPFGAKRLLALNPADSRQIYGGISMGVASAAAVNVLALSNVSKTIHTLLLRQKSFRSLGHLSNVALLYLVKSV